MAILKNKIVFITGASSGIGKACAEQFAAQGAHLILAARRVERLVMHADELQTKFEINVLPLQLDVQDKEQVKTVIQSLPEPWKNIDILINNAGLAIGTNKIQDSKTDDWDIMIKTNIQGLLYVTHEVLPFMIKRNHGHIINIGSTAGHECYPAGNVYCATKHAVKAISKSLRIDLLGMAIRVTEIDPGQTETEFSEVRWQDKKRAKDFYRTFTPLVADDIAEAALFCATRPAHVNIAEMLVYPTCQASANHLHKQGEKLEKIFD